MAHSIGKTIASLRKTKGWTQIELAEKLNVSDKAVSKWESEGGFPEITQLPVLAEIFDVSIDYLMTGKETKPEIITMSKIEFCAKNDDPTLLGAFTATSKDENNKTFIDYIKQYKSLNVLKALIDNNDSGFYAQYKNCIDYQSRWIDSNVGYNFYLHFDISRIQEDFILWLQANVERKIVQHFLSRSKLSIYDVEKIEESGCLPIIHYLVDNFDNLPKDQKDYYFGTGETLDFDNAWLYAYPYFIDYAYTQKKKELFDTLLEKFLKSRDSYHQIEKIKLLRSTVENAYKAGDTKLGEKLNAVCKSPLNSYEIHVIMVDNNKKLSKKEKQLLKTIHDGVVCISELLEIKDFQLIKKTLNEYPIHPIEIRYKERAETDNDEQLYQRWHYVYVQNPYDYYKNRAEEDWEKRYFLNSSHLYLVNNGKKVDLIECEYWGSRTVNKKGGKNIQEVLANLQAVRKRIIDELGAKLDKERLVSELTKNYFEKQLAENNIEIVIIKLCVRLEAILRCDYHYEGDFGEMLKEYCNKHLSWDDDGYACYDEKTINTLNNLRIKRNTIVHAEKKPVDLSLEDIQYCIDYICKMG